MVSDPQLPNKEVQVAHSREALSSLPYTPSLEGTHASLSSPCGLIQGCAKQERAGLPSKPERVLWEVPSVRVSPGCS